MNSSRIPFFPEMEPPPKAPRTSRPRSSGTDRPARAKAPSYPCEGCPLNDGRPKIEPAFPEGKPMLYAIAMRATREDEAQGRHFCSPGAQPILKAFEANGVPADQVVFADLTRCNPRDLGYGTKDWETAVKKCSKFLDADLARYPDVPMVLFGAETLKAFTEKKERIEARRGLWMMCEGRPTFIARHPGRDQDNAYLVNEFTEDMRRMADKLFDRIPRPDIELEIFPDPLAARDYLAWLATVETPWAFDIESYDGRDFPSRKLVSTDPCHPDFRLRGIAVATSPNKGAWIECKGWESRIAEVRPLLDPAFTSPCEKGAFNGGFDDEGLVYPGWVSCVSNRTKDGMLAMIALGDATHASLRLEKAVVEILKQPQYWLDVDKGRMRDFPIQQCAENAVGDACYTLRLCLDLDVRLEAGDYIVGQDGVQKKEVGGRRFAET